MKKIILLCLASLSLVGCASTGSQKIDPAQVSAAADLTLTVADIAVETAHLNGQMSDADYQKAKLAEAEAKAITTAVKAAATSQPSK